MTANGNFKCLLVSEFRIKSNCKPVNSVCLMSVASCTLLHSFRKEMTSVIYCSQPLELSVKMFFVILMLNFAKSEGIMSVSGNDKRQLYLQLRGGQYCHIFSIFIIFVSYTVVM